MVLQGNGLDTPTNNGWSSTFRVPEVGAQSRWRRLEGKIFVC